ncbi:carbohydrate ABC transporter permease [Streptomyces coelicoflavus]|uniref:carbohydrate ABC transporter permease n=1 Tax=Streptomyces coelicoflavus TaxID=285562 RepID=UPI0036424E6D
MTTTTTTPPARREHGHQRRARIPDRRLRAPGGQARTGVLLVAPAFAFVVAFVLVPLGFAVYISLTNWPLIGRYRFIGLDNYRLLVEDPGFWHALGYTLVYTLVVTPLILLLGYLLAMLVRSRRPGTTLLRTAVFLPYVIGLTTLSFFALLELQPTSGVVNFLLDAVGLPGSTTNWLIETVPATAAICALVVWGASGLTMVLIMAAMQGVPSDVYEAAALDGATAWQREVRITMPLLRRTITLATMLSVIGSVLAFNQFFILTAGGPGTSTQTIVMWIYNKAFVELRVGAATAGSLVLVAIIALLSAVQYRLLRSDA